jgi:hypothetical protein
VNPRPVQLGLRANSTQFALLVAVNAFVGAMVGMERSTLPLIGREDFGLLSSTAVVSFVAAFGLAKACTNLGAGAYATRVGRRRAPRTRTRPQRGGRLWRCRDHGRRHRLAGVGVRGP